jgi:hypothetical protein
MPQTARASTFALPLRVMVALVLAAWVAGICLSHASSPDSPHHGAGEAAVTPTPHEPATPLGPVAVQVEGHHDHPGSDQGCHIESVSATLCRVSVFQPALPPPTQLSAAAVLLVLALLRPLTTRGFARMRTLEELGVLRR